MEFIRNTWRRAVNWFKRDKAQAHTFKPEPVMPQETIEPKRKARRLHKRPHKYRRSCDRPIW